MRVLFLACVLVLLMVPAVVMAGIFDDEPEPQAPGSGAAVQASPESGAAALRYVVPGSQQTMVSAAEKCVSSIEQKMREAAEAGDTKRHDLLAKAQGQFVAVLETLRRSPVPPSIYPLSIGKTGCLYAVRRVDVPVEKDFKVESQAVSWFSVRVKEISPGKEVDAELYDNTGKVRLYRVRLTGVNTGALKPGGSFKLLNVGFQCTAEEGDAGDLTYHLKVVPIEKCGEGTKAAQR